MPRIPLVPVCLVLSLWASASLAQESGAVPPANRFLERLAGDWIGQAVETPVGPVDYDLRFTRCADGALAGVADPGASLHYWQFRTSDSELTLTFLSTFGGNREPVQLQLASTDNNTLHFHAPELQLLTLAINLSPRQLDIRVFHNLQPHVHIHLNRSEPDPANRARETDQTTGCSFP